MILSIDDYCFMTNILMTKQDTSEIDDLVSELPKDAQSFLSNKEIPEYQIFVNKIYNIEFIEKYFIDIFGNKVKGYPIKNHPELFFDIESNSVVINYSSKRLDHYTFDEFSSNNSRDICSHTLGYIFITISNEDPNIGLIQESNDINTKIYNIKEDKIIGYLN